MQIPIDLIEAQARSVKELLANREYGLDYYQRDYRWGERQINELLDDLTKRFLTNFRTDHPRRAVASYSPYFLGSIVVSQHAGMRYLIDGQQRLTSLTLLLIHLLHLADPEQAVQIAPLISSAHYGEHQFNLYVPERTRCLEALREGRPFDPADEAEGVRTIYARYQDIENRWGELFPSDVVEIALPYFVDWLMEKVTLVEISTTDDDMAYEVFETMNDRGLSLTPTEMLKGFLLSNVGPAFDVAAAEAAWRARMSELSTVDKSADSDFFKSWLRASYAETIRERKRGATSEDFDYIGTQFHRWVRDNHPTMGLNRPEAFFGFIVDDLKRMSAHYRRIRAAEAGLVPELDVVHYNHALGVPMQATLLLASITPDDTNEIADQKMRAVATYLDLSFAARFLSFRNYGYSPMYYSLFTQVVKQIRAKPLEDLGAVLLELLREEESKDPSVQTSARGYSLHGRNGWQIKYLLARLTSFVDAESGRIGTLGFSGYLDRRFEIEHIWAKRYDRHKPAFTSEDAFLRERNRLGDLLLLPKDFNASFQDDPFPKKREHYLGQNLVAQSLHPLCYENDPGFLSFIAKYQLPFRPYPDDFSVESIEERQDLYARLCAIVWSPSRLKNALPGGSESSGLLP